MGEPLTRWHISWLPLVACATPDNVVAPETGWMAKVFAPNSEATIGQILLPGAFNSTSYACDVEQGISPDAPAAVLALWGSDTSFDEDNRQRVVDWARTQDRSVGQQLEDGIRFVELNVTLKDGVITTWHSVYGVPLDEVLDELVAYAVTSPLEVVVLTFGLTLDVADWPLLADALTAPRAGGKSVCDLVYDGGEGVATASISDVRARERNLIWAPEWDLRMWLDARGGCPASHGSTDRTWSLTVIPEGVEAALGASVDARDPEHLLVNDFVFSLDGSGSVLEQAEYIGTYQGVQEASEVLGFSGDFPGRLIEAYNVSGKMNVLAGAYYQDTNLILAAIAENEARWAR